MTKGYMPPENANRVALRIAISDEVERIGIREAIRRLKISPSDLQTLLSGGPVDDDVLASLQHFCPRYADLEHFMSCYFYEGYDYETGAYHRWEPAVDRFIADEPTAAVAGTAADIERLIIEFPDDPGLLAALRRIGCRFSFQAARISPTEWLQGISERMRVTGG